MLTVTHAILVEQDLADIFLPAAKLCNYVAAGKASWAPTFQTFADVLFAAFAIVWIPTRHGILPVIYYSIWTEAEEGLVSGGCSCGSGTEMAYNPSLNCRLDPTSWPQILLLYKVFLAIFQLLMVFWLRDIVAAVYKALVTGDLQAAEAASSQAVEELDAPKGKGKKKKDT